MPVVHILRSRIICIAFLYIVLSGIAFAANLVVDQSSLAVNLDPGHTSLLLLNVTSSGAPLSGLTISPTTTSGGNWLQVNQTSATSTPVSLFVFVDARTLSQGVYNGSIAITASGAANSPLSIPVTLTVGTPASGPFSVDQTSLSFTGQTGGSSPSAQQLNVSSSPSGMTFSASAATNSGGNWLQVPSGSATTPATVTVSVDTTGLSTGSYSGTITLTPSTGTAIGVSVTLTLSSTSGPALSVNQTSLTFTGQSGGSPPSAQQLSVSSSPSGTTFSASATSTGNWLQVPSGSATTPATVTVSVNTTGLSSGTYSGTITLTPSTGAAISVSVTLTLTVGPALSANVTSLQFYYQVGVLPSSQTFIVTSSSTTPLNIDVTATMTDGTGWLSATPLSGTTPQTVTVAVSPLNLAAGVYHGTIAVSAPSSANNASVTIPVTLTVSSQALLTVSASPAPFIYQTGTSAPASQSVTIASSGGALAFSAGATTSDGSSWLAVSPLSGTTPQALTIAVNPASLSPGSYSGAVVVSAIGAINSPLSIPITLTISSSNTLVVSAQSVVLNYQIGGANEITSQPVTVTSTGGPVTVAATATTPATLCGPGWLQVFPASFITPGAVQIGVNPIGFSQPQSCIGAVVLAGSGSPVQIPVTLIVATTPFLNIQPLSLSFSAPYQGDLISPNIVLSTTDNKPVTFTANATTSGSGPWLFVYPSQGSTPYSLTVSANPSLLGVGSYTGSIKIASPAIPQGQTIPVTFTVTPTTTATVSPTSLSFTQTVAGAPPQAQNVTVSATGGAQSFTASVIPGTLPAAALSVTPAIGTTPATLSIGILSNSLPVGSYSGSVAVAVPAAGSIPITIPVTLQVTSTPAGPSIAASPPSLTFNYQQGGGTPGNQQINATSTGAVVTVTAAATDSGGAWLAVSPVSGQTPAAFAISVNPSGLAAASYTGTVTLTAAGAAGSPITIPVQFNVTPAPVVAPSISAIANAASGVRGSISPGEIVAIGGAALGPASGAQFSLTSSGMVDTTLAGTTVYFDEFSAPLLYASASQINAIVPYEVASRTTVQMTVQTLGGQSDAYTIQIGATAPGIFITTQNGRGQAAILNEDNSYNGQTSPAARGSIVQVFATGEGGTQPPAITGSVTGTLAVPVATVSATVGILPAEVVFAGAAPQAVAGLFQVNVRIPADAPTGDVPIMLTVGNVNSQTGATVAVK